MTIELTTTGTILMLLAAGGGLIQIVKTAFELGNLLTEYQEERKAQKEIDRRLENYRKHREEL